MSNPGGQLPYSRAEFDKLTPRQKGIVSYFQAAWNKAIPDTSPYPKDSKQFLEWSRGRSEAVIMAQEGDD